MGLGLGVRPKRGLNLDIYQWCPRVGLTTVPVCVYACVSVRVRVRACMRVRVCVCKRACACVCV